MEVNFKKMDENEKKSTVMGLKDILGKVSEEITVKREEAEGLKQKAERIIEATDAIFLIFEEMKSKGIQKFSAVEECKTIGIFRSSGIESDFPSIELTEPEEKVFIHGEVTNAIKRIKGILLLELMPADDIQELKKWISKMRPALANDRLNEFLEVVEQITSRTSNDGFKVEI